MAKKYSVGDTTNYSYHPRFGITYRQWLIGQVLSGAILIGKGNPDDYAHNAVKIVDAVIAKLDEEATK